MKTLKNTNPKSATKEVKRSESMFVNDPYVLKKTALAIEILKSIKLIPN